MSKGAMKNRRTKVKTVPNQRIVRVNKEPANKNNIYACINKEAMRSAMEDLQTKAGFKLWCYFADNQPQYTFALSSKDFCEQAGCGMDAYRASFEELVLKGYLVKRMDEYESYDFYEKSLTKQIIEEVHEQQKITGFWNY